MPRADNKLVLPSLPLRRTVLAITAAMAGAPAIGQTGGAAADIVVLGQQPERPAPTSRKFTPPLIDPPKSVTVISQALISETGSTTLVDALRTVPGITFNAGEGGQPAGDNL